MIHLELNDQQFNIIVEALGNCPYRAVAGLMVELSNQVQKQRSQSEGALVPQEIKGNGQEAVKSG